MEGAVVDIPGNSCWSGDQRVTGSLRPPRHWRRKAKQARVKGRRVKRKSKREARVRDEEEDEDCEEEEEEEEMGLREN